MIIRLLNDKEMRKLKLPDEIYGDYWITDKSVTPERKLVNIKGFGDHWEINGTNNVQMGSYESLIAGKLEYKIIENARLYDYSLYSIKYNDTDTYFLISEPSNPQNFFHYRIKGLNKFTIGRGKENHILFDNAQIAEKQVEFIKNEGKWFIKNLNPSIPIFINNEPVKLEDKYVPNGDSIYILGFKVILIGDELFFNKTNKMVIINTPQISIDNSRRRVITNNKNEEDDETSDVYTKENYFAKIPRISNIIEEKEIKIDEPPQKQENNQSPMWLTLGTSLSMGLMMVVSSVISIKQQNNNEDNTMTVVVAVMFAIMMVLSMVLFPILSYKYEDKHKEKQEEKRQQKYLKYLEKKYKKIDTILQQQRNIMYQNYLNTNQCEQIILRKTNRLWERSIEDDDFLTVRLGRGEVKSKIKLNYSEERFTLDDDNLLEKLHEVEDRSKNILDAPITLSLNKSNITAIIDDNYSDIMNYVKSIILQLITFQSYEDLKIVLFVEDNSKGQWDFIKLIPHIWNNAKTVRYFGNDYEEIKEIETDLMLEYKTRVNSKQQDYSSNENNNFAPYYLIITDNYLSIKDLPLVQNLVENKNNVGFGLLTLSEKFDNLPEKAKNFINIQDGKGILFEHKLASDTQQYFNTEDNRIQNFDQITYALANIPIKFKNTNDAILPNMLSYLQMYNVGKIEQLNILDRWRESNSVVSLKALIGLDTTARPIYLDIHEKAQGVHGLVAGSTGSGKSEFLISYILSMAISYSPEDVNFVIIDYKGSGLASAFDRPEMKLPHLAGTITNISTSELERSLLSFQSELKRREKIFNETLNKLNEGTMDIYKYQRLYHEGVVDEPLPHLIIVSDEFAELKQQQPDFMDQLVSISRVGRSLGVHLILCTQKPQGVVDDQIRSNCNFRICLKVQDRMDSIDVIEIPDAVKLRQAGQFFMSSSNTDPVLGQSGYAGANYVPRDVSKKQVDKTIKYISDTGKIYKEASDRVETNNNLYGEELTNIVKYICNMSKERGYSTKQLWLNNIPEDIYIDNLKKKYKDVESENEIRPIIGEYDDPFNQRQGLVKLDLTNEGNVLIYGTPDSGRETLLSSLIYSIITNHKTIECEIYVMDFGSESLKIYKDSPQVGDVVFLTQEEKIDRLLDMLDREIKRRIKILSNYNGNIKIYQKLKKSPMPLIILMINNYSSFYETYQEKYDEVINRITREGIKCDVKVVMTASSVSDVRYRLTQNFSRKICLRLNNADDYMTVFNIGRHRKLDNIFGRGFIKLDDVYEFQTAKITTAENYNQFVITTINSLNSKIKHRTIEVPTLPNIVTIKDLKNHLEDCSNLPIGIVKENLSISMFDFSRRLVTLMIGKNKELVNSFLYNLFELTHEFDNVLAISLDIDGDETNTNYTDPSDFISKMNQVIDDDEYEYMYFAFVNMDKILSKNMELSNQLGDLFEKAKNSGRCSIIVTDGPTSIKGHEFEPWYKNYVDIENGIWVGKGIREQYLFNVDYANSEELKNAGDDTVFKITTSGVEIAKGLGLR